jgi:predicted secreted hydrolase
LSSAAAQGLFGLGTDADGYHLPQPGTVFEFPRDHGAHPGFRIEWWYVTANLDGADGREYGAQWTLFRTALAPPDPDRPAPQGWSAPQIWFGHAGVTTPDTHLSGETYARGGIGQAGVTAVPFAAWINDWQMRSTAPDGRDALSDLRLTARGDGFSYDLALTADGPLVLQGAAGYSVKSAAGQASHYYSQPHYTVTGTLALPDGPVPVTGQAWLDREWSSQPLTPTQTGWDWFSLHLDGGEKLMVYRLRDSAAAAFTPGTWVRRDGTSVYVPPGEIVLTALAETRVAGRDVPTEWRVQWQTGGVDVTTRALNPSSWMDTAFPYWEGPVRVTGSHTGRGYLEMTGYE